MKTDATSSHARTASLRLRIRGRVRMLSSKQDTRDSALALADQMVASAANFLTGVIVGRACEPSGFGLYLLGVSIVTIATTLQNTLVIAPYSVLKPRLSRVEGSLYLGSTVVHHFGISLLSMAALALASIPLVLGYGPDGLASVMGALSLAVLTILLREFARRICFARLEFRAAIVLDTASALLQLGALLAVARLDLISAASTFWAIGASSAVVGIGWLVSARRSFAIAIHKVRSDLTSNWLIGKWLLASALLWESNVTIYPWLLTASHDTEATGIWAACFGVIAMANPLILGMQNSVGPQMAHEYAEAGLDRLQRIMVQTILVFSLALVPIAVGLAVFGGTVIRLIYGAQYAGHGWVVVPLALELLVAPARFAVSRALIVIGRSNIDFATNAVSVAVMVTVGIWLTSSFGPLGVAVAILAGSAGVTTVKYICYGKIVRELRREESPSRTSPRVTIE